MARRRRPPRPGALTELPPLRILGQMATLQGVYYLAAVVLMGFTSVVGGSRFSLDMVFGWAGVRADTTHGWVLGLLWVLDGGLIMSVAMVMFVARSKLVLDFTLSLHAIHLAVVTVYSGQMPRTAAWWLVMAAASAVAVGLGTWGCRYRELKPISFGGLLGRSGGGGGSGEGSSVENGDAASSVGDEEQAVSRVRGRGRGRDGAGAYEMVRLDSDANP